MTSPPAPLREERGASRVITFLFEIVFCLNYLIQSPDAKGIRASLFREFNQKTNPGKKKSTTGAPFPRVGTGMGLHPSPPGEGLGVRSRGSGGEVCPTRSFTPCNSDFT